MLSADGLADRSRSASRQPEHVGAPVLRPRGQVTGPGRQARPAPALHGASAQPAAPLGNPSNGNRILPAAGWVLHTRPGPARRHTHHLHAASCHLKQQARPLPATPRWDK